MSDAGRHLDALALEALRTGEGGAGDRAHLAACERCRAELAEIEALASRLADALAPGFEVPPERDSAIRELARAAAERVAERKVVPLAEERRRRRRWAVPVSLVATLVVGVIGVQLALLGPDTRPREELASAPRPASAPAASADAPVDADVVGEAREAARDEGAFARQAESELAERDAPAPLPASRPAPEPPPERRRMAGLDGTLAKAEESFAAPQRAELADAIGPELVLERTDLDVHVGERERVRVEQRLRNELPSALGAPARYRYPVSKEAQLSGPEVKAAGRVVEAVLDTSGLRDEGDRVLTTWALPAVGPGEPVEVELAYSMPGEAGKGHYSVSVPLGASPVGAGVRVEARISADAPIAGVTSTSHRIETRREAPERILVRVLGPIEPLARELVLEVTLEALPVD